MKKNAAGGKGPCGVGATEAGTSEGMARESGPNHPGVREHDDKVRCLQRKLFVAAKQQKDRRFHALFDRICRRDVLQEACNRTAADVLNPIDPTSIRLFTDSCGARIGPDAADLPV